MVRDYTNNIAEAEGAIAQTIGNLRMLEDDYAEDQQAAVEWGRKALRPARKPTSSVPPSVARAARPERVSS